MADKTINTIKQTDPLMAGDVQDLLASFAAAIESDELRVVPIHYNAGMWSRWRNDHLKFLRKLIGTTNEIPETTLWRLKWLAHNYNSAVVTEAVLELLAGAASGSVEEAELLPAARFFEWLISDVSRGPTGLHQVNANTRSLMALWFPTRDPLRIALDPECRITMKSN